MKNMLFRWERSMVAEDDEHWLDEADHENPAVSNDIVLHDKEVWLHA